MSFSTMRLLSRWAVIAAVAISAPAIGQTKFSAKQIHNFPVCGTNQALTVVSDVLTCVGVFSPQLANDGSLLGATPHYITFTRCSLATGNLALTSTDNQTISQQGVQTATSTNPSDGRCYAKLTGGASTVGTLAGLAAAQSMFHPTFHPRGFYRVLTPSSLTGQRFWVSWTNPATGLGNHAPLITSTSGTKIFYGIGCDPAVNGSRWVLGSDDGTTESGVDTGVACAASTGYSIDLDCSNYPTSCRVGINGTYTTKTTNLPLSAIASGANQLDVELFAVTYTGGVTPVVNFATFVTYY